MTVNYPMYLVDMMYDYLKLEDADAYDPNKLEDMLYMIECEIELYEKDNDINDLEDRDAGWYADLTRQVQQAYDYVPQWF
jgi:hypothetical protein